MAFLSNLFGGHSLNQKLIEAARARNRDMVIQFLDDGANINAQDATGASPLMHALDALDVEMIKLLIDRGADVELADVKGITPLSIAVFMGLKDGVRLLIYAGANPERKLGNISLLDAAIEKQDAEMYALLQTNYSLDQKLIEAARVRNRDMVIKLLDAGANVNAQDAAGGSALGRALNVSDVELTKLLIERGADVELATNDRMTPLAIAVLRQFTEGVRILLDAGANPERMVGEHTAFEAAEALGNDEILGLLVNKANQRNPFYQRLKEEDSLLAEVKVAAMKDLPQFIQMFNQRDKTPGYVFAVKVPIEDENGREHLWLMVYEINDQFILGTVDNDLTTIKIFKCGDAVQTPYESVEDLIVINEKLQLVLGSHMLKAINVRNKAS